MMPPRPAEPDQSSPGVTSVLLALAHTNDRAALARICERYKERLLALARTYLPSGRFPALSGEDAALSALGSFHHRFVNGEFPDLQDRNSLWKLLATITRRKVLQALRREQAKKRGEGRVVPLQPSGPKEDQDEAEREPVSREPDPLEAAIEADLQERLFQCLTETNRQVALLRLDAWTNAEIARQLGLTEKAVERRLDTIREELRRLDDEE